MNKIARALGLSDDDIAEEHVFDCELKLLDNCSLYKHDKAMSTYYCNRADCVRSLYRNKGKILYGFDRTGWEELELTLFEKENYHKEMMIDQLKRKRLRRIS